MALAVHLLGSPRVERDGLRMPDPPGRKVWALLAHLVLVGQAVPRERLAALLFEGAADPLAALRWNLAALRRLLGTPDLLRGPRLALQLPAGTHVDVDVVRSGSWRAALAVADPEAELLEGMSFPTSPTFELWLTMERRQLAGAAEAVLHEAALARLGAGAADEAADLCARLVRLNPFDENFQALLVRSLSSAGHGVAAAKQAARCRELFRRELGVDPGEALRSAMRAPAGAASGRPVSGTSAIRAQLQAGRAALSAGAVEAGLHCLRRAVADAAAAGCSELHAEALVALGAGMVHSVRGADEEGAAALHEALGAAERDGHEHTAAAASRELGYVEFLQGRYGRARRWLARAGDLAAGDAAELARVHCIAGAIATDVARYADAFAELSAAERLASGGADRRHLAYVLSMLGRARLLHGDLEAARDALDRSLRLAEEGGWTAFLPWPEALRAEIDLAGGDVDGARARCDHAFALGCELADPCWEALAARGLGRAAAAEGDPDGALEWFAASDERASRVPDGYLWVRGYALDAACAVAREHRPALAPMLIDRLQRLSERTGMRELSARALLHRGALGDTAAAAAAATLIAQIDTPALRGAAPALQIA